jgi:hypothetical protein
MKPTPAQIEEARALSTTRLARGAVPERVSRLALIHVSDQRAGLDLHFLAAPFSYASWAVWQDESAADEEIAQANLIASRVVYPADALDACRIWPALVPKIAADLVRRSKPVGPVSWSPIDVNALPACLSREEAQRLAGASHRGLWVVTVGSIAAVVEQPDADVYQATRARFREARAASKGIVTSFDASVRGAVKFCSVGLEEQLDATPWLMSHLFDAWSSAGGAEAECKSELV